MSNRCRRTILKVKARSFLLRLLQQVLWGSRQHQGDRAPPGPGAHTQ